MATAVRIGEAESTETEIENRLHTGEKLLKDVQEQWTPEKRLGL